MDDQNQPVPGANVWAMPEGPDCKPGQRQLTQGRWTAVDARGRYRIFNLPPGSYAVAVTYGASSFIMGSGGGPVTAARLGSGYRFYPDNSRNVYGTIQLLGITPSNCDPI